MDHTTKIKTTKLLEENLEENLCDHGLSNDSLERTIKEKKLIY